LSNKRLIKSTGGVGLATFASRVLGFTRDILIANFFGTTMLAEAFVVSFRIPNLLRDLIGEGAANAAFVPILTEYNTTHSKGEFWHLAKKLLGIMVLVLFLLSLCGVLFAPAIVKAIAPGFAENTQKLEITIRLTRIMFPFIFLVGLTAYGMGVLNSLNHFAAPALGPALVNLAMILSLVYLCPRIGVTGLAFGVLAGGVLQVFMLSIVLQRKGLHLFPGRPSYEPARFVRRSVEPAIRRIWRLLVPRFFGSAVYQMSVIVDNIFSTFGWIVGIGAPAALWYSYRLFHLPLAIFGIALATVALSKMSAQVARKDILSLKDTINFSLRSVFLVLVPAGIGLATFGKPIIRVLFERGEFTAYSSSITNNALFFYSFGLFACGGIKILVNAFFSLGDTKTPVKVASVSFFINLTLNFILMWPLKVGGLALATSVAATFNFVMLYILLVRKIGDIGTKRILNSFSRILASGVIMGIFAYMAGGFLNNQTRGIFADIAGILTVISVSMAIYVFSSLALGVGEMKRFTRWILKRS